MAEEVAQSAGQEEKSAEGQETRIGNDLDVENVPPAPTT